MTTQHSPTGAIWGLTLAFNAVIITLGIVIIGTPAGISTFIGVGALLSLALAFVLQRTFVARTTALAPAAPPPVVPAAPEAPKLPEKPQHPYEASAVQILSILQRKGRLIDFLQEDISAFGDAQIGAAVRTIHEGCKDALAEYVTLEPVMADAEGSSVTVEQGFDARAIRLSGNVTGAPPFTGTLRHRGWRVAKIDLPERLTADESQVVAAAEVEIGA